MRTLAEELRRAFQDGDARAGPSFGAGDRREKTSGAATRHHNMPELMGFAPRRPDAAEFALRNRVLLLKNGQGVGLDIALGAFPFETHTIERSSPFVFPTGQSLITCSAEDLMVHKCFANREKDWLDVDGILSRQWNKLNLKQVRMELKPLAELKEEPEIVARLEQKIARHKQPFTRITPTKPRKKQR
jgi:hypothetical protein